MINREQFSGCLIGQCLGDALGAPVEGNPPEACQTYVDDILNTGKAGILGRRPFPFGQYTDDSQLARELMQSYLACQQFQPEDYAQRIAAIFVEKRIVGRGRATEAAAFRLAKGIDWTEAGTPSPSAGNGSAMRAAPMGLFFFDDIEKLITATHDQGRITHQDIRCSAGAVAIAAATAMVIQSVSEGASIEAKYFLPKLSEYVAHIDQTVAESLIKLINWVKLTPAEAVQFIGKEGLPDGYDDGWQGISPFVTCSVLWSLYSFLRSPEDYWETIGTSIAVGGDVDTTAAMAGAISGAYLGLQKLPQDLVTKLTDQGTWQYAQLIKLADDCYDLKMSKLM